MKQKTHFSSPQLVNIEKFQHSGGFSSKIGFHDFRKLISDFDICFLQETWLEHKDNIDLLGLECFKSERKKGERVYKYSGGLFMLYTQ